MPRIIADMRFNENFFFTKEEVDALATVPSEVVDLLKSKNLTYVEAIEVLRISKILLEVRSEIN